MVIFDQIIQIAEVQRLVKIGQIPDPEADRSEQIPHMYTKLPHLPQT